MKDGAKWYPRYPVKFLGGVQGLTSKEHAVYSVVLDLIYQHGGGINNDPKWVSGWISDMGADSVRKAVRSLADRGLLTLTGDEIRNRVAEEYCKTDADISEKRADAGRAGGKAERKTKAKLKQNLSKTGEKTDGFSSGSTSVSRSVANDFNGITEANAPPRIDKIIESPSDTSYPQSIHGGSGSGEPTPPVIDKPMTGSVPAPAPAPARVPAPASAPARNVGSSLKSRNITAMTLKIALTSYNEAAAAVGWPVVKLLTSARESALRQRLVEVGGLRGWADALDRARASPLLTGDNDRGWKATFDFLVKQGNFAKLMEGNYDRKHPNPTGHSAQGRPEPRRTGPAGSLLAGFAASARDSGGEEGV